MKNLFISSLLLIAVWFRLDDSTSYMLVPGGWIYRTIYDNRVAMVFVPNYMTEPMKYLEKTPLKPR